MKCLPRIACTGAIIVLAALLGACGDGGGSAAEDDGAPAPAASVVGTAATGAALAGAPVAVTNAAGNSPCTEPTIFTSELGAYSCTLKAGEQAPFFIVVTDPSGNSRPLVSVTTQTPAAGVALTVNATPLTTAIVAQLTADGDVLGLVHGGSVDATALALVTERVIAQLRPVLAAVGAPADYNPFGTGITAGTAATAGNSADLILEVVKVVSDPATGAPALATIADPTPVPLASTTSAGGTLGTPGAAVTTLPSALQVTAGAFERCFAAAVQERVLATNANLSSAEGGPEVTQLGAACGDLASTADNAGGLAFLHNGYRFGQLFFKLLTSDTMTGARFALPEVMAFYPLDASAPVGSLASMDHIVLNIKYADADGNAGNQITVAARVPGSASAARPTDWWLVGDQDVVDVVLRLNIRRVEQLNPAVAARGNFLSGMGIAINPVGPGSIFGGQNLAMARVSGPGLPGLVFKRSSDPTLNVLDLFNKNGALDGPEIACGGVVPSNCPLIWFARTKGITGTDATTLDAQPDSPLWAQPADAIDPAQVVRGAKYKVELFYGTNTGTPDRVVYRALWSDLVQATRGVALPWNTLGERSLLAFDPSGPLASEQAALTVDWIQNPWAQQVDGVWPVVQGAFLSVVQVPRGALSATLTSPLPAFSTSTNRSFALRYRTMDGSGKQSVFTYN